MSNTLDLSPVDFTPRWIESERDRNRTCGSPMDSFHGNPTPSDPMESVCQHFPPPSIYTLLYNVLSLSRTDMRQSDGLVPRQPISIGSDGDCLPIFSTPSQLYYAVYLLSPSRTDMRQSDGLVSRQPVLIGSDGVRLPTFSTPSQL